MRHSCDLVTGSLAGRRFSAIIHEWLGGELANGVTMGRLGGAANGVLNQLAKILAFLGAVQPPQLLA